MNLLGNFNFSFSEGLWLAAVYFVISTGLTLLLPKYKIGDFVQVPSLPFYSGVYLILHYLQLVMLSFLSFSDADLLFIIGLIVYISGIFFYSASMFYFAVSDFRKPAVKGMYKFSRHPVYLSFFVIIFGAALASGNIILLLINFLHFYSATKIMKAEEEKCLEEYGQEYKEYMSEVKRFI